MLRLATTSDKDSILNLLKDEASFNTFLIGDIITYGFDSQMQKVYINDGKLDIIVVVYFTTMLIYQKSNTIYDLSVVMNGNIKTIMGKEEILGLYSFEGYSKTIKKFMELTTKLSAPSVNYRIANANESEMLASFYMKIEEFVRMYHGYDEVNAMISNRIQKGEGRHYYLTSNNEIIAHVNSAAENPYSAIIGGVATLKEYRNQGYATSLLKALCYDLQKEHIMPCLFYDNEDAGRIYKKLGFNYIGNYIYLERVK